MKADDQLNLGELRALRDHYAAVRALIDENDEFTDEEKQGLYAKMNPRASRIDDLISVLEKLRPAATITPDIWEPLHKWHLDSIIQTEAPYVPPASPRT